MKKAAVLVFLLILSGTSVYAKSFSPQHDKVASVFQGSEEPAAKDALWTAKDIFKIGVIDNGKNRDGYAMYACNIISEHGLPKGAWVQIIDIVKLTRSNKWVKLGEARCTW